MFRSLTSFIVGITIGCLIMYIGPIKVATSVIKTTKTIIATIEKEVRHDGSADTGDN